MSDQNASSSTKTGAAKPAAEQSASPGDAAWLDISRRWGANGDQSLAALRASLDHPKSTRPA